ncbi:Blp family class II bacteriocin [Streptococcus sobrinus]|uniref:Blp family class II bacteriocin n=1 Tax=Streptococcus sobrinus TaxID=1310 RepID=UPI00030483D2|nr:Blp family class II bacteriocin [Streptococcus sobrinus]AWN19014.1 hypothetical protein DK181_06040 [Streptococcus sobrinus]AWN61522.1 hypothetical protein DLJ52_04580 [Streptococcus sobrinus]AWN63395.1 hypothetical protein DLJ51_04580 [Streptococcus sobrinus]SQG19854.1 bacteriocin [Streptococcus sobrinus]
MNVQLLDKFEAIEKDYLSTVKGGNWRCYVGTAGGAIFGAVGGPWGAIAGGTVANAYFCAEKVS